MACNSKTAHHGVKRSEIWASWILVTHILGTFDLVRFKVIWGSFGALFSKWHASQQLVLERNGWNLGYMNTSNAYGVHLTL